MERFIEKELLYWKNDPDHLPLLLRGARQVGKSYILEQFGKSHFDHVLVLDFELSPQFKECFIDLDPKKIISLIELRTEQKIIPGKSLLILDEIQLCPQAILSLRYFKEKLQELHVIGAGSLLEFTLDDEMFSFPVGRVQYMYMKPLSFQEFLLALGKNKLLEFLSQVTLKEPPPPVIHQDLLKLVRQYLLIGGMPAVVKKFIKSQSLLDVRRLQGAIFQSYRDDFPKYHEKADIKLLSLIFEKCVHLVTEHFQYVKIDRESRAKELRENLNQLCKAAIFTQVFASAANRIPLSAEINDKKFKLLFLDIGLLQYSQGLQSSEILQEEILQVNRGILAEQFVGQELLAYQDYYSKPSLFFWEREKVGSSAEVDYLLQSSSHIIPVEVKAGKIGKLRSLKQFMETKKAPFGIRISELPLSFEDGVLNLPFYLIGQIDTFLLKTEF